MTVKYIGPVLAIWTEKAMPRPIKTSKLIRQDTVPKQLTADTTGIAGAQSHFRESLASQQDIANDFRDRVSPSKHRQPHYSVVYFPHYS